MRGNSLDKQLIKKAVRDEVIKNFIKEYGIYYIPVAVSNRHVHLSTEHKERLFGKGYTLKPLRPLSQPKQFVCEEKVKIVGPRGSIDGVRVLGPERKKTQVEISITDSYKLGIQPVVRMSGDIKGTPGARLIGPCGEIELSYGVIVSARHLHISKEEAKWYDLKDGDIIRVKKIGAREVTFDKVIVRAGPAHSLEMHIDTDEANAAGIKNGETILMEK